MKLNLRVRRISIIVSLAVGLFLGLAQSGQAAVIDFEEFILDMTDPWTNTGYYAPGSPFVFDNAGGSGVNVSLVAGTTFQVHDLYEQGNDPNTTGKALMDFDFEAFWFPSNPYGTTILFDKPVMNFSLVAGDFGNDDDELLKITAYDAFDNILAEDSVLWPQGQGAPFTTLMLNTTGIMKIHYQSGGDFAGTTWIDNVTFTPIPEPTSLILLGSGLAGLLGLRRRLKK
jgi:hypothetical protein